VLWKTNYHQNNKLTRRSVERTRNCLPRSVLQNLGSKTSK